MRSSIARGGFVLPWIIMSVAILAILAAVVAPSVATMIDRQRAIATVKTLTQIGVGIGAFENAIHSSSTSTTNNYPGDVSQLSTVVRPTLDRNSCNLTTMTVHDSTDWVANGPFVPMYIPTTGLWTPIGLIVDDIPARTSAGALYVLIAGVSTADMAMLDAVIEGGAGVVVTQTHSPVNDTTTVQVRLLTTAQVQNKC
jgi:Tfp pilus assembly protein PilE